MRSIARLELALLAAFAAVSLWVLGLDLWQVVFHGRIWTGTDGGYGVPDQMQHVAWVRDASSHVLVSNLFQLGDTPNDYLQPAVLVSAVLAAVGVAPWLAFLLWKPVAVVWTFFAVRTFVHRQVAGRAARAAAIALAIFFVGWGQLVAEWRTPPGSEPDVGWLFHTDDSWLAFWSWGYVFGLLAVATLVTGLLAYERDRTARRVGWPAPALAAITGSLHPWQGEIFILVVVATEAVLWLGRDRSVRLAVVTLGAAALPFLYYWVLRKTDPSWGQAPYAGQRVWPLKMVAFTLLPLALPAALAYRHRVRGFLPIATRMWPPAALILYLLNETRFGRGSGHSLLGVTIPLGVLCVEGVRSLLGRLPPARVVAPATVVLLALVIPPLWNAMWDRRNALFQDAPTSPSANFVARGERDALDFLAGDARPGGVVAQSRLGSVVPALTGRHTFVGNYSWSRGRFFERQALMDDLFTGSAAKARRAASAVERMPGARFVLADCTSRTDLARLLPSATAHRFGCAAVYVLSG